MVFADLNDLWHMGGHGPFVWASYGLAVLLLVALAAQPLLAARRLRGDILRRARRDQAMAEE